jgi:atypical dual specificity phosphatase
MNFSREKEVLPYFPKTPHLPFKPNLSDGDCVSEDAYIVFQKTIHIEEKIDGASVGMTLWNDEPLIRNRDHILRKGYEKDTPAKMQFRSIWTWWYDHRESFANLSGYSVYGEWLKARHGIYYDSLPDWFIAYDLYDHNEKVFVSTSKARELLVSNGFYVPAMRFSGTVHSYDELVRMANLTSSYSEDFSEGIYIKICDENSVTHRFKMVREGYVRGRYWDGKIMLKNEVKK